MRPLLAALSTLALLTPPADAGNEPLIIGTTCGFVAVEQFDVTGQTYEGVLFGAVAAVDGFDVGGNPMEVSMTCRLLVEGVPLRTGSSLVNVGGAAVVYPLGFQAFPERRYSVCTDITARNGARDKTMNHCEHATSTATPPQEVCDLVPVCPVVPHARFLHVVPQAIVVNPPR